MNSFLMLGSRQCYVEVFCFYLLKEDNIFDKGILSEVKIRNLKKKDFDWVLPYDIVKINPFLRLFCFSHIG